MARVPERSLSAPEAPRRAAGVTGRAHNGAAAARRTTMKTKTMKTTRFPALTAAPPARRAER